MKMTSVSELKAKLSAYLERVQQGEDLLVTDRGRVIARITPVAGDLLEEDRRRALVQSGRVRPPTASLPQSFWDAPRAKDPDGRSISAIIDERTEGR